MRKMFAIAISIVILAFGLFWFNSKFGWASGLSLLLLLGLGLALVIFLFVGIAFGVAFAGSITMAFLTIVFLHDDVFGVYVPYVVVSLALAYSLRVGWMVSERLPTPDDVANKRIVTPGDALSIIILALMLVAVLWLGDSAAEDFAMVLAGAFGLFGGLLMDVIRRRFKPYAFLSYRHGDNDAALLAKKLDKKLKPCFLDNGIRAGDHWKEELILRLDQMTVFVAVIGPEEIQYTGDPGQEERGPGFWVNIERG